VKGKMVERSAKLYKRAQKCQSLSQKLASFFIQKIVRTPLPVVDKKQPPLKTKILSLCFTNEKL
jgi:hypothetical protein